jgi:hypothetical protein
MGTTIKITPPGQAQKTILAYNSCSVNMSVTDRAGSFSLELPFWKDTDISDYVVGSDVEITQDSNIFRGWIISPPTKLNGVVKTLQISGADYTAKTQKIIITESYTNTAIDAIVDDLFEKYVPWVTRTGIQACTRTITVRYPDLYLWDIMEQICTLTGYDWFIDTNLNVNFFQTANSINSNILCESSSNFKKGSANFTPDSSKLVNKLWVKGAKAVSLPFTQDIEVDTIPIPLFYKPRTSDNFASITVTIGGVVKTVGIQNIDAAGTKDFLINSNEKLLIPDLVATGTGTIEYCYEYPVKIFLEDKVSQANYGVFEDILSVDTADKSIARQLGSRHLIKYSTPVLNGSIEPFTGQYTPGELLRIEIPSLNISQYLIIKSVSYDSAPLQPINIKIQLEQPERDISIVLKDMNTRLNKLERELFGSSDDTTVERYNIFNDQIIPPSLIDDGLTYHLHQYRLCGTFDCGVDKII